MILRELIAVAEAEVGGDVFRVGFSPGGLELTAAQVERILESVEAATGIRPRSHITPADVIWRAVPDWDDLTSGEVLERLQEKVAIRPTDRTTLFGMVIGLGAAPGDFGAIWQYPEYIRDLDQALANGWLTSVRFMLGAAPFALSEATRDAVEAALGALGVSRYAVAAGELGFGPAVGPNAGAEPETVEEVDEALGRT